MSRIQRRVEARIRALAKTRDVSLNHLADYAGVSQRQLYAFLAGDTDVTLGWLEKVADALDVDLLELFVPTE